MKIILLILIGMVIVELITFHAINLFEADVAEKTKVDHPLNKVKRVNLT